MSAWVGQDHSASGPGKTSQSQQFTRANARLASRSRALALGPPAEPVLCAGAGRPSVSSRGHKRAGPSIYHDGIDFQPAPRLPVTVRPVPRRSASAHPNGDNPHSHGRPDNLALPDCRTRPVSGWQINAIPRPGARRLAGGHGGHSGARRGPLASARRAARCCAGLSGPHSASWSSTTKHGRDRRQSRGAARQPPARPID